MGHALDPKKVKSAQRVLEVLEYFNAERQEGTVMDIARTCGYPQSSTSELLSCLVFLGYLRRDLYARTYKPSARVAVLGSWIQPHLFRSGNLLPLMDELAVDSAATIVLASRVGMEVQVVHVVTPGVGERADIATGDTARLLHSAPGKVLLTTVSPDYLRKIVHRLNAEAPEELRLRYDDLTAGLAEVRANGYAAGHIDDQRAMISVLLPQSRTEEQLSLSICASPAAIAANEDRYVQLLRAAVTRHLGLVNVQEPRSAVAGAALRQVG